MLQAKILVYEGQAIQTPDRCCCCFAPKAGDHPQKLCVGYRQYVDIPMPWCSGCRAERARSSRVIAFVILGCGALGAVVPLIVYGITRVGYGWATLGFFGGLIVGVLLCVMVRDRGRVAGHALGCEAVSSWSYEAVAPDELRRGGRFRFENRAFAAEWVRLNGGG